MTMTKSPLHPAKLLLSLAVWCCCSVSQAALLPIHPTVSVLAGGETDPVGGTVINSQTQTFSSPTFSGTLKSEVIFGDTSNPLGGLTFTYLLSNDLISSHSLERITISDFTGFQTDTSFLIPTIDTFPISFDRFNSSTVGVSFNSFLSQGDGPIGPGQTSSLIVIQTNAPYAVLTTASVIDGSTASVLSYGPSAVPEPGTWALAGLGLLIAGWSVRRRNAQ